jgi:hypothetical protein
MKWTGHPISGNHTPLNHKCGGKEVFILGNQNNLPSNSGGCPALPAAADIKINRSPTNFEVNVTIGNYIDWCMFTNHN